MTDLFSAHVRMSMDVLVDVLLMTTKVSFNFFGSRLGELN